MSKSEMAAMGPIVASAASEASEGSRIAGLPSGLHWGRILAGLRAERAAALAKPDWARNGWEAKLVAAGDETLADLASEMVEERRREYGE